MRFSLICVESVCTGTAGIDGSEVPQACGETVEGGWMHLRDPALETVTSSVNHTVGEPGEVCRQPFSNRTISNHYKSMCCCPLWQGSCKHSQTVLKQMAANMFPDLFHHGDKFSSKNTEFVMNIRMNRSNLVVPEVSSGNRRFA
jgi:hypothetical protein